MRMLTGYLIISVLFFFSPSIAAQYALPAGTLEAIPVERMPTQNNRSLRAKEAANAAVGRAPKFAVAIPVSIVPKGQGLWTKENGLSVWRTRISSPGAKTLNLGFSEFYLPQGASLYLQSPEESFGPFTSADNDDHNQFWTPMLDGDELIVELRVPAAVLRQTQLRISFVNHDFTDVNKLLSGSCNLDVACSAADGWGIVDGYRDVIRSVGAITLGGTLLCSGLLVNNTNHDGKPFFLTASHCEVTAENAPSLVAYWNYENSECRQPGSSASGAPGNGSRDVFNSGAALLADHPDSDHTLLLFDDPIDSRADAFFAGWSQSSVAPTDTVVTVHHPQVQEKRISFSFQNTFRAEYTEDVPLADGDHLTVPDWDIGTTEGGSSGAPLFDRFKRLRGVLHGGLAACGNDELDSYGFFHVAWEGGGTPESRLKDWLDPCGTGVTDIGGFEQSAIASSLMATTNCITGCAQSDLSIPFQLGTDFPAGTQLMITGASAAISASLTTSSANGGMTVNLMIEGGASVDAGSYEVTISARGGSISDEITFYIELVDGSPSGPSIVSPAEGENGVAPRPQLSWTAQSDASSYEVQLATSLDFSTILQQEDDNMSNSLRVRSALAANTQYFWRVRSRNSCGLSPWQVSSFTTSNLTCTSYDGEGLPAAISPDESNVDISSTVTIAETFTVASVAVTFAVEHTWLGDLSATLTSPRGTTVTLFENIGGFFCDASNLYATFDADAALSSDALGNSCVSSSPNNVLEGQPQESFDAFIGEEANGDWIVTLNDGAGGDGGRFLSVTLDFCTTSSVPDLSIGAEINALDVCITEPEQISLSLGAGFPADLDLRVAANGQSLDNFSFNFDALSRLLTVDFVDWERLEVGSYDLAFFVISPDGSERSFSIPMRVQSQVAATNLVTPDDNDRFQQGTTNFRWEGTDNTTDYVFQYSTTEDFSVITYEEILTTNSLSLTDVPEGGNIYWRVITRNACGQAVSSVRQFLIWPTGVHDFGENRRLSVYPNPVRGQLTVDATGAWPRGFRATLHDATGRQLADFRGQTAGRSTWNIADVPAGIYYLRLTAEGTQRTERLVVMR